MIPRTLRARLVLAAVGFHPGRGGAVRGRDGAASSGHELRSSPRPATSVQRAQQVAQPRRLGARGADRAPARSRAPVSGRQIVVEVVDARGRIISRPRRSARGCCRRTRVVRDARSRNGRAGFETIRAGGRRVPDSMRPRSPTLAGRPPAARVPSASDTTDINPTPTRHLGFLLAVIGTRRCAPRRARRRHAAYPPWPAPAAPARRRCRRDRASSRPDQAAPARARMSPTSSPS